MDLRFLCRWGITLRVTTNKAQKVPEDYQNQIISWLQFNRPNSQLRHAECETEGDLHPIVSDQLHEVGRFSLQNVCNMDQTPLPFEYLSGRTYNMRGDKTVCAKATKSAGDKRQATRMLAVFADEVPPIQPLIMFKGTEDIEQQNFYYAEERKKYDPHVIVWFNQKGYANEKIMVKWIVTHLIPALNHDKQCAINGQPNPSLISLDAAKFHKTQAVLNCLRNHDIIPSMIPGGCTGLIQPLDVAINGPVKNILGDVLDIEMDNLGKAVLDCFDIETESAISQRRFLLTKAVGEAWERVYYF